DLDAPRDRAGFPRLLSTARQSTGMVTPSKICRAVRQTHSALRPYAWMSLHVAMRSAFASRRTRRAPNTRERHRALPSFLENGSRELHHLVRQSRGPLAVVFPEARWRFHSISGR